MYVLQGVVQYYFDEVSSDLFYLTSTPPPPPFFFFLLKCMDGFTSWENNLSDFLVLTQVLPVLKR